MFKFVDELFSLSGRIALVTGGSSGIGRHMAATLARAGGNVVLVARRKAQLMGAVEAINAENEGRASAVVGNLSERDEIFRIAEEAAVFFGSPDIIINAAGTNLREPTEDVSWDSWGRTLDLNLSAPFFLTRAMVPSMQEKGFGNIINIASLQSFRAFTSGIAYGASKGGIAQLTRAMAETWSKDGIIANAIAPGFFPTELTEAVFGDPELMAHNASMTAIGRNGKMQDLDGATVFLASRAAAYVTGQVIFVDGGYSAK